MTKPFDRNFSKLIAVLSFLALAGAGWAKEAPPAAADPQLEKRALVLAEELRCLVCQNQTLADSTAPLAVDLREQIREKIKQGMSNEEIVDFMVARYGDFVRYRPPLRATTALLWFGPVILLLAALIFLVRRLRMRQEPVAALTEAEHARAAALLTGGEDRT